MYSIYYSTIARKLGWARTSDWGCAIRRVSNGYETVLNSKGKYQFDAIANTDNFWFADPILFSDGGKTWLFVEAFNKAERKGEIGVFDITDGKVVNFRVIIQTPTHMSYPFVFKHDGDYYMIPETGAAKSVTLYKSISFPDVWVVDKTLIEGDVYRDSTIFRDDSGKYQVLTYKQEGTNRFNMKNTFTIFGLDMDKKVLTEKGCIEDKRKMNRPAGPVFMDNNIMYRVAQKCNRAYGESINVFRIGSDMTFAKDKIISKLDGSNIILPDGMKPVLIHTYSQAGGYEVIDYRCLI